MNSVSLLYCRLLAFKPTGCFDDYQKVEGTFALPSWPKTIEENARRVPVPHDGYAYVTPPLVMRYI